MKSKLRTVHVSGEEWKWLIDTGNGVNIEEIRVYSPTKKMFRVKPESIPDITITYEDLIMNMCYAVTPKMIKNYIVKTLIK